MYLALIRKTLFGLFLLTLSNTVLAQEGEWVRLLSKTEFLQNFTSLSRAELVVNYARHFPSVNYSAEKIQLSDPVAHLQKKGNQVFLPEGAFYSQRIFGKQFLLWDRTALAIMSLQAFMKNDSRWISEAQRQLKFPPSIHFDETVGKNLQSEVNSRIQELGKSTGSNGFSGGLELVLTYLAIHDATKVHPKQPNNPFLENAQSEGISNATEHDRVLADILEKAADRFPELANLEPSQRAALNESVKSLFNLGHFIQAEGTVGSYQSSLEAITRAKSPGTWALYLAHIIPDMAGVAPLPGMNGSLIFSKPKAVRYQYALQSLATMSVHSNATKATLHYLDLLIQKEYPSLSSLSRERQLLLVQLAEQYEAYTPEKLSNLRRAVAQMEKSARDTLIRERVIQQGLLNPKQKPQGPEILLQQSPKVLKGKGRTLIQSLELIANVYDRSRDALSSGEVKADAKSNTLLLELDGLIESQHGEFWELPEVKEGQGKLLVGPEETAGPCIN